MVYLVYFLIFFTGAAVGSFLNVLISRSIAGKDWIKSRSICDHCHSELAWYDMIPLLSFVVHGGKSRCCKKPLTLQHPIVEGLMGMLFLWWALMGSYFFHLVTQPLAYVQPSFWLLMGIILTVIAITDYFYGLVPVIAVYAGIIMTLGYRSLLIYFGEYQFTDFTISIISMAGAALWIYILRLITKKRGMGEGDIYIAALMGLLLSYPRTLVAMWVSFVIGAIAGVFLILSGKKKLKSAIPFGPFMVLGIVVALIWGF